MPELSQKDDDGRQSATSHDGVGTLRTPGTPETILPSTFSGVDLYANVVLCGLKNRCYKQQKKDKKQSQAKVEQWQLLLPPSHGENNCYAGLL